MNTFKNIKSPTVLEEIDVYDFLDRIKNPEQEVQKRIFNARNLHSSNKSEYNLIKEQLPCFTLNFDFDNRKSNNNIKAPTGFIYIDLDGTTDIDLSNDYIFATWLSLSGKGRGILVKVDNLKLQNFKETYFDVSNLLNIKPDFRADKATQYCVHSYDNNLFINNDSKTYQSNDVIKKSPTTVLNIKKERRVNTEMVEKNKLRFNNISDYDFKNEDYIVFWEQKEEISEVYVPPFVPEGKRESILSTIAYQFKALNDRITEKELLHFISGINHKRCFPPLEDAEIEKIIKQKMRLSDIEPIANKERRIIFDPESKLNRLEKITITNQVLGELRCEKSRNTIRHCIENWEFETLGKITQQKLIDVSGLCKNTIEKYYKEFKDLIKGMNQILKSA